MTLNLRTLVLFCAICLQQCNTNLLHVSQLPSIDDSDGQLMFSFLQVLKPSPSNERTASFINITVLAPQTVLASTANVSITSSSRAAGLDGFDSFILEENNCTNFTRQSSREIYTDSEAASFLNQNTNHGGLFQKFISLVSSSPFPWFLMNSNSSRNLLQEQSGSSNLSVVESLEKHTENLLLKLLQVTQMSVNDSLINSINSARSQASKINNIDPETDQFDQFGQADHILTKPTTTSKLLQTSTISVRSPQQNNNKNNVSSMLTNLSLLNSSTTVSDDFSNNVTPTVMSKIAVNKLFKNISNTVHNSSEYEINDRCPHRLIFSAADGKLLPFWNTFPDDSFRNLTARAERDETILQQSFVQILACASDSQCLPPQICCPVQGVWGTNHSCISVL